MFNFINNNKNTFSFIIELKKAYHLLFNFALNGLFEVSKLKSYNQFALTLEIEGTGAYQI